VILSPSTRSTEPKTDIPRFRNCIAIGIDHIRHPERSAAAKEAQADVIVMMSQASPLRRFLGGSFIERTIRKAPCPVLTILPSAEIRTDKDERVPLRFIDRWAA
jgi:hypothetical protein